MSKLKKSMNKENILIIIFLILVISGIMLNNPINKNDEVTLLGETLKMYNGSHIYKDVNVLITPLFFYIGLIMFKIFGANLLIFRLYGIAIYVFFLFTVYIIFKKLKISRNKIYISLCVIILYFKDLMKVGANYNILSVAISICGMIHIISTNEKNNKYYLLQGIITLLIFMTKQNFGIYYFLAFALCEFFIERFNIKTKIINIAITSIPVIIGMLTYCIYLYFDKALYNFIDYTFLGMKDFNQNIMLESWIPLLSLFNIVPIFIMYIKKKQVDKRQKILLIFSVVMLLIVYPIVCGFHAKLFLIYSIISFVYLINSKQKNCKIAEYTIMIIAVIYIFINTILNISNWARNYISDIDDPYFGAVYSEKMDMFINKIENYIANSDKKVVIVSPDASLYNIRLNINNGILDCPSKGNVGINGKEKLINEILNTKNAKFLITKNLYYQDYPEVHAYIKKNYTKTDEIGMFEVYE